MATIDQELEDFAKELNKRKSSSSSDEYDDIHRHAQELLGQKEEKLKGYDAPLEDNRDLWSKFKDYATTAGIGFTEGATANKAAEIMSAAFPIKNNTKQVQGVFDKYKQENPWTYGLSEAAGTVVSPLARLGLPAFAALSGAEGDTLEEKAIGAGVGGAVGVGTSALIGKALPYIASKVPELTKAAGTVLQVPTDLATSAFEPVGAVATKIPFIDKYLNLSGKSKSGTALFSDSAKVKALKSIEDAANLSEIGAKTANAIKSTEREISEKFNSDKSVGGKLTNAVSDFLGADALNRSYSSLSAPEKSVVMASMANGFRQRGLKLNPVALGPAFEQSAKNLGIDLDNSSVRDVVRTINKRDPEWAVNAFKNVSDFYNPLLEISGNVTPEYYEAQMSVNKLHDLSRSGAVNRMMQTGERLPVKSQMSLNEVGNYAYDASHMTPTTGGPTIAGSRQFGPQIYQSSTNESTKVIGTPPYQNNAQQKIKQEAQQVTMTKPWLGDATEESIKKYTGREITDQNSLQEAGAIASGRLKNIYAGQAASNMVAGAVSGGSAFTHHGFPAISSFLGYAPQAVSWAGKAGQALEQKGATMTPDNFASSVLSNPSVIAQLSNAPGEIGDLARSLNQGMQTMGIDGVKSRLFVAMSNPSTRKAVLELMGNNEELKQGTTANLNQ